MGSVVKLRGLALGEAQTLVEALQDAGYEPLPINNEDQSRDLPSLIHEIVVGIFVNGSYDAIKAVVSEWVSRKGLSAGDVDVRDAGDEDGKPDSDEESA